MRSPGLFLIGTLVLIGSLTSCFDKEDGGTGEGGTTTGDDGTSGDDDGTGGDDGGTDTDDEVNADVSGLITVTLYTSGEDGEREELSWEDYSNGVWAFGNIFVGAYFDDEESGNRTYVGSTVIDSPSVDGNEYSIPIQMEGEHEVYVYAVVDWYQDGVVGSNEPTGVYPHSLEVENGSSFGDVDIAVLAPPYTGGGGCDTLDISGDIDVTISWTDGDAWAMMLDTNNEGPYHTSMNALAVSGGGANAAYDLYSCTGYGDMNLIGAWDTNGNGMADPLDKWGSYVNSSGEDGNPISVSSSNLSGYDIQIPFGDASGPSIVPFVRLSGSVSVKDGSFDDLPAGSSLYVTALKYRPDGDLPLEDLEDAYDTSTTTWDELTGQSSVDFSLTVPANTVVYMWAYSDSGDNVLNGPDDWVAAGGSDSNGKVSTGTTSTSGYALGLSSNASGE